MVKVSVRDEPGQERDIDDAETDPFARETAGNVSKSSSRAHEYATIPALIVLPDFHHYTNSLRRRIRSEAIAHFALRIPC
ncbi:hypothetical protein JCM18750_03070 [Halostagnicola bangensis]